MPGGWPKSIGIPFYVVNFEKDFQRKVIDRFCDDYFAGRTPNPCVLCNQVSNSTCCCAGPGNWRPTTWSPGIMRGSIEGDDGFALRKGLDPDKDQSYFLFTLTQEQMGRVRFPLGGMTKEEVRCPCRRAWSCGWRKKPRARTSVSSPMAITCAFWRRSGGSGQMDGEIVHVSGEVLGRHRGTYRYTVGQRRGLGIVLAAASLRVGIDAP